jgi:hypothetical protein
MGLMFLSLLHPVTSMHHFPRFTKETFEAGISSGHLDLPGTIHDPTLFTEIAIFFLQSYYR